MLEQNAAALAQVESGEENGSALQPDFFFRDELRWIGESMYHRRQYRPFDLGFSALIRRLRLI